MECKELVHNVLAISQSAFVSVALKVEDNVLHIIIVPVIMLPHTMPINPAVNPLCTLLKVLSTLVSNRCACYQGN